MAGTVLGKRRRETDTCTGLGFPTRTKKRVQIRVEDDEARGDLDIAQDEGLMQRDTPEQKGNRVRNAPAKSGFNYKSIDVSSNCPLILSSASDSFNDENAIPQIATPQTPRHRDALSKKIPVTPRHRVLLAGRAPTPRTPRTPSTPTTSSIACFNDARKVFTRSADPGTLVGRANERAEIQGFVDKHMATAKGGCLYVSGPPGTGKSALVTEVCRALKGLDSIRYAYINCMSIKTATNIYGLTATELGLTDDIFETCAKESLQATFLDKDGKQVLLVVLDEIDQLLSLDHDILYNFFEWSFARHSKLVLIGIANALDLTDRFLPRLKARNLRPTLLPFLPYTPAETASVLTARARSLLPENTAAPADFTPFLHPTAIQLISKKVASQTGDLRKAFNIAQRAIDLVEAETREKLVQQGATSQHQSPLSPSRTPLGENPNLSSPSSPFTQDSPIKSSRSTNETQKQTTKLSNFTAETAPRATLAHVVRVTSGTLGNASASSRLKTLTLQQKAVLCALISLEQRYLQAASSIPSPSTPSKSTNKGRGKGLLTGATGTATPKSVASVAPMTTRGLFEAYTALCRQDDVLHSLSSGEFGDVISGLEALGLVVAVEGGRGAGALFAVATTPSRRGKAAGGTREEKRLRASVGVKDLEAAVEGVGSGVLKRMLAAGCEAF